MPFLRLCLATGLLVGLLVLPAAADDDDEKARSRPRSTEPQLLARAIYPANRYQPGPVAGKAFQPADSNGQPPPYPSQPLPGFSAVLKAGGGKYWGMPDNGFGSKANSPDFLLRVYRIEPRWKTSARRGGGEIRVRGFIQLRDPDRRIPDSYPLVNGATPERHLTGSDFDIESVRRTRDRDFWFGEEFGPFILHTDRIGKVLEAPIQPPPDIYAQENPYPPEGATLPSSRGYEGMAISPDGRTLYPFLEGPLLADRDGGGDPRRRVLLQFDVRSRSYTARRWQYRVDEQFPAAVIGDFTAIDRHRFVLIERDDDQGATARQKKIYLIDLRRVGPDGYLEKRLVLDLLDIADPRGVSAPPRDPDEFGVADRPGGRFSFPLQSVESLEVLGGGRLLIANDNNYPGSDGRWKSRSRPDDVEMIVVDTPLLRGARGGDDDDDDD
jgi:hypothetical protein